MELSGHFVRDGDRNSWLSGIQCAGRLVEEVYLQTVKSSVDKALRTAIQQTRLIRFLYQNKERIVEPHDYGIQNGSVKLLSYQVDGSSSGPLPDWRWFEVDAISDIQLLDQTFPGGRPTPSGQHHKWDKLFIRVKPAA